MKSWSIPLIVLCALVIAGCQPSSPTKPKSKKSEPGKTVKANETTPKTETKEEPKPEAKEEPKTEAKEPPKTETKEEPKTETKEEPKTDAKEPPKTEKTEPAKVEAKTEVTPPADADIEKAIQRIKELGGKIEYDPQTKQPISVNLDKLATTNADLKLFGALKEITKLYLYGAGDHR